MRKTLTLGLVAAALTISACAKTPSAIAPVPMGQAFAATPCNQVVANLNAERQRVNSLSGQQRAAATGDAIGVFLILVPVSSLTGSDVEGELATSKGKVLALEERARSCGYAI
jgi:hypothetical protein